MEIITMLVQPELFQPKTYYINSWGQTGGTINGIEYKHAIIIQTKTISFWNVDPNSLLSPTHFDWLDPKEVDTLLIGTGAKMKPLSNILLQWFFDQAIGVEYMSSKSAARTFNLLTSDDRKVAAALMV